MSEEYIQDAISLLNSVSKKTLESPFGFAQKINIRFQNYWNKIDIVDVMQSDQMKEFIQEISPRISSKWEEIINNENEIGENNNIEVFSTQGNIDNQNIDVSYVSYWDYKIVESGRYDDRIDFSELARKNDFVRVKKNKQVKNISAECALGYLGPYFQGIRNMGKPSERLYRLSSQLVLTGLIATYAKSASTKWQSTGRSTNTCSLETYDTDFNMGHPGRSTYDVKKLLMRVLDEKELLEKSREKIDLLTSKFYQYS